MNFYQCRYPPAPPQYVYVDYCRPTVMIRQPGVYFPQNQFFNAAPINYQPRYVQQLYASGPPSPCRIEEVFIVSSPSASTVSFVEEDLAERAEVVAGSLDKEEALDDVFYKNPAPGPPTAQANGDQRNPDSGSSTDEWEAELGFNSGNTSVREPEVEKVEVPGEASGLPLEEAQVVKRNASPKVSSIVRNSGRNKGQIKTQAPPQQDTGKNAPSGESRRKAEERRSGRIASKRAKLKEAAEAESEETKATKKKLAKKGFICRRANCFCCES